MPVAEIARFPRDALYNRSYVLFRAAGCIGGSTWALYVAPARVQALPSFDGCAGGDRWCARRDGRVPQAPSRPAGGVPVGGPARDKAGIGRRPAEDLRLRGQPLRGDAQEIE